jgi:hypothetical protein
MASQTADLPEFDNSKTYLLTGDTLNQIMTVIRRNMLTLTGDIQFDEVGPEGSELNLNTIDLQVCIDGTPTTKTFVITD